MQPWMATLSLADTVFASLLAGIVVTALAMTALLVFSRELPDGGSK